MLLTLDGRGPRYAQITRALLQAIRDGDLKPGTRLASHRQLAADLRCARNLIVLAYEQLILEGYLETRPRAGTFVSAGLPNVPAVGHVPAPSSTQPFVFGGGRRLTAIVGPARRVTAGIGRQAIDFVYGLCEPDPRVVRRLRSSFAATLREGVIGYGDPAGDSRLRERIADRLRGTRGIVCDASQVIVTNGAQQGLDLCARLLIQKGDRAVVEDPGYEAARAAFATAGATIVPVAVDDDGLDPGKIPDVRDVRIVYVTPSHQFPTGGILPAPRRHALLSWARRQRAVIIEDDYDGELRYQAQPLPALAGLDPSANVIYCGTFSKSLFPALRLGYLVLPLSLIESGQNLKWLADRGSSLLLQHMLSDLLISGEYDRHLRRMRRRYQQRRDVLIDALGRNFGGDVEIAGAAAGLHIVAWLPRLPVQHVDRLIAVCAAQRVGVYSLSGHAVRRVRRAGLILGYGMIAPPTIERGVQELAAAYRAILRSRGTSSPALVG